MRKTNPSKKSTAGTTKVIFDKIYGRVDSLEDIRAYTDTLEESKDREKMMTKLLALKRVEDMAKTLQDKASKYQLNSVAEDTTPLPKSALVTFSKAAETNCASYEVLSNSTTEAG